MELNLSEIEIGRIYRRDMRVMRVKSGDFMMRTLHGWMVGPLNGLLPYADSLDDGVAADFPCIAYNFNRAA